MRLSCLIPVALAVMTCACSHVDDERIPAASVNVELSSHGYWDIYGVHGLGQSKRFIKSERIPADFPFTAMTFTGFGGILLVTDLANQPLAYDLACPFEVSPTVRVDFNPDNLNAECPQCHSVYNVCEYQGSAVSGPAYERKYGLRRYRVLPAATGGYNIVF